MIRVKANFTDIQNFLTVLLGSLSQHVSFLKILDFKYPNY